MKNGWIRMLTTFLDKKATVSAGYHVCCSQHIAKLSTMTRDAIVYKVSSCFFFFFIVSFFVFDCS